MKILILQLARFGDIFITWPTLRALRRRYPGAEIHLVVRRRFASAVQGCEAIDRVITLETGDILAPLFRAPDDLKESLLRLTEWTDLIAENDYDQVINLSFSPFSSYLTSILVDDPRRVRGYSRHSDGYLAIPDDASAYFYAQVGVGKFNRYHLGEVFAAVAGVDLMPEDWRPSGDWQIQKRLEEWQDAIPALKNQFIVLHPGASQRQKAYPGFKWQIVMSRLAKVWPGKIVMIGSDADRAITEEIFDSPNLIRLIGKTEFADVVALMSGAKVVVGCDSAPMHLASFTNTPCVNLSFSSVCFWETGPRVPGSHILFAESPEALPSDRVVEEIQACLENRESGFPVVIRTGSLPIGYEWRNFRADDFSWQLINAIYSGGEWPILNDATLAKGFQRINEAVDLALDQIAAIEASEKNPMATRLLEQADRAIRAIGQMVPELRPLVAWFETENLRIGPTDMSNLIGHYRRTYSQLKSVTTLYTLPEDPRQEVHP